MTIRGYTFTILSRGDKLARTHYLNPSLYNKLYAVMQYENALALRTSLETGWRIDDVLHLKLSDLDGRTLSCVAMKTGKADKKVISADLAKRLKQIAAHGRLFDGRYGNKPRTRQAVWHDVKKAAKRLQIVGNIAPHSARKTYAVEDFKAHGLKKVQDDLQHDRVSTTLVYAFADLIDKNPGLDVRKSPPERRLSAQAEALPAGQSADVPNGCGGAVTLREALTEIQRLVVIALAQLDDGKGLDNGATV